MAKDPYAKATKVRQEAPEPEDDDSDDGMSDDEHDSESAPFGDDAFDDMDLSADDEEDDEEGEDDGPETPSSAEHPSGETPSWGRPWGGVRRSGRNTRDQEAPDEAPDEEPAEESDDEGGKVRHDRVKLDPNSPLARERAFYVIEGRGEENKFKATLYKFRSRRDLVAEIWRKSGVEEGSFLVQVFLPKFKNSPKPTWRVDHFYVNLPHDHPDTIGTPNESSVFKENMDLFGLRDEMQGMRQRMDDYFNRPEPTMPEADDFDYDEPQQPAPPRHAPSPWQGGYPPPYPPYPYPHHAPHPPRRLVEDAKEWAGVAVALAPVLKDLLGNRENPAAAYIEAMKSGLDMGKESKSLSVKDMVAMMAPIALGMMNPGAMQGMMQQAAQPNPAATTAIAPVGAPQPSAPPRNESLDDLPAGTEQKAPTPAPPKPTEPQTVTDFVRTVATTGGRQDNPAYWANQLAFVWDEKIGKAVYAESPENLAEAYRTVTGISDEQYEAMKPNITQYMATTIVLYSQYTNQEVPFDVPQPQPEGAEAAG